MQTLLMNDYLKIDVSDWLKKSIGIVEPRLQLGSAQVPLVDWLARLREPLEPTQLPSKLYWVRDPLGITWTSHLYWTVESCLDLGGAELTAVNKGGDTVIRLELTAQ